MQHRNIWLCLASNPLFRLQVFNQQLSQFVSLKANVRVGFGSPSIIRLHSATNQTVFIAFPILGADGTVVVALCRSLKKCGLQAAGIAVDSVRAAGPGKFLLTPGIM